MALGMTVKVTDVDGNVTTQYVVARGADAEVRLSALQDHMQAKAEADNSVIQFSPTYVIGRGRPRKNTIIA